MPANTLRHAGHSTMISLCSTLERDSYNARTNLLPPRIVTASSEYQVMLYSATRSNTVILPSMSLSPRPE